MRTELLRELGGGYDARFPHSADMFLWLRASAHADVGRVNGVVQAFYRVHDANMHTMSFGGQLDDFEARRDTFDAFFELDGDRLPGSGNLWRLARRRLAREAMRQMVFVPEPHRGEAARALFDFASQVAPRDRIYRGLYRLGVRRPLNRPLFRVEAHRGYLRDQRELRAGT